MMTRATTGCAGIAGPRLAPLVIVIATTNLFLLTGCQMVAQPVFAPYGPPLDFPPLPLPVKVRYVGEITSAADLKPRPTMLESFNDALVGAAEVAFLEAPRAVLSLPDSECVWVADPGGQCLHRFDLRTRRYLRVTEVNGSRLISPVGLARGPTGTIYVCDAEVASIYQLSARTGEFLEELRAVDYVLRPVAMHYDSRSAELLVVDAGAHDLKVLDPKGQVKRIIGRRGFGPGEFNFPLAITVDADTIWVVDTGNHRVQGLKRDGTPLVSFGQAGDSPGDMALPKGIAIDSRGHLYVVDARFENVQVFDRQGHLLLFYGQEGTGPGDFWLPSGIHIDDNDRIWICDSYNRRIKVFDYVGSDTHDPDTDTQPLARTRPVSTREP